jgi:hypothetical protein
LRDEFGVVGHARRPDALHGYIVSPPGRRGDQGC